MAKWTVKTTEHVETIEAGVWTYSSGDGLTFWNSEGSRPVAWFRSETIICVVPGD